VNISKTLIKEVSETKSCDKTSSIILHCSDAGLCN